LKRFAQENGVFYTLYIQKEEMAGTKNDHATWKSLGYICWIRVLSLRMSIEDPPNLYKIESALASDKFC
jgi:hypothetical protein